MPGQVVKRRWACEHDRTHFPAPDLRNDFIVELIGRRCAVGDNFRHARSGIAQGGRKPIIAAVAARQENFAPIKRATQFLRQALTRGFFRHVRHPNTFCSDCRSGRLSHGCDHPPRRANRFCLDAEIAAALKEVSYRILTYEEYGIKSVELAKGFIQLLPILRRRECNRRKQEDFRAEGFKRFFPRGGLLRSTREQNAPAAKRTLTLSQRPAPRGAECGRRRHR